MKSPGQDHPRGKGHDARQQGPQGQARGLVLPAGQQRQQRVRPGSNSGKPPARVSRKPRRTARAAVRSRSGSVAWRRRTVDQQGRQGTRQQPQHLPHVDGDGIDPHLGRAPVVFQQSLVQAQQQEVGDGRDLAQPAAPEVVNE